MHYIKSFFEKKAPEGVHDRFVRYGRGTFGGPKASVKAGKTIKVSATAEYVGVVLEIAAKNAKGPVKVSGMVFAKRDVGPILKDFLAVKKMKNSKGLFSAEAGGSVSGEELVGMLSMMPDATVLFDAEGGASKLKCKKKLPKPGGSPDDAFCAASFTENALDDVKKEILFDLSGDFKEASVSHEITVEELVKPAGVTDPARLRTESKRKGKIKRTLTADGKTTKTETTFLA